MGSYEGDALDLGAGDEVHLWSLDSDKEEKNNLDCKPADVFAVAYAALFSDGEEPVEDKKRPRNRDPPLKKVHAFLQKCPEGWFDRYDLDWDHKRNNGLGGKQVDTLRAIIPWDRLEDFVQGEQSMRDFPCTFNRKTYRTVEAGSRRMIKESTASLVIRFRCVYGPIDKTAEVKKDIESLFAKTLESRSKGRATCASKTKSKTGTNWVLPPKNTATGTASASKAGEQIVSKGGTKRKRAVKKNPAKKSTRGKNKGGKNKASENQLSETSNIVVEDQQNVAAPIEELDQPPPEFQEPYCHSELTEEKRRQKKQQKKRNEKSWKRGCQAFFVAKQVYLDPTLCELQYHCVDDVNREGKVCHGSSFEGYRSSLGTRISTRTKDWIVAELRKGLTPPQVMAQHKKDVMLMSQRNEKPTRDTFIMPHDVLNLANSLAEELWQKHEHDATSVRMWTEENPESYFLYNEHESLDLNEAPKEECTYTLGIQTERQWEVMLVHGHKALSIDATFGTNDSQYPLYSVLVFDEWQNGIPIAFILTSRCKTEDIVPWLTKLRDKALAVDPNWYPNAVIVDCAQAELNGILMVWPQTKIMLCLWHVRKAWAENLMGKIKNQELRLEVLKSLVDLMYTSGLATGAEAVKFTEEKFKALKKLVPRCRDGNTSIM